MVFGALLAIPLSEGTHTVTLTFRPDVVLFGPLLSLLGFLLVFLLRLLEQKLHTK
jgi:hypothetical protein